MYDQPVSQFSYAAFILRRVLYGMHLTSKHVVPSHFVRTQRGDL
jgi:hypothetical protein